MQNRDDWLLLAARWMLAALFLGGAVQKMMEPEAGAALLRMRGLPEELLWLALPYNAFAGLALVFGLLVRPVALSLAAYCVVTSFFHLVPDDAWQMSIFVKNWAIAGGCLALAVAGPGAFAVGGGYLSRRRLSRPSSV